MVLAATGFDDNRFVSDLALGAEHRVDFQQRGLIRRGFVDSFYENLVIEFEYDLSRTGPHAQDQLRTYVAGAWREDGSDNRSYIAVATDGLTWRLYTPRLIDSSKDIDSENIELIPSETWAASGIDEDAEGLRWFLNRLLFRKYLVPPTAANFTADFGLSSPSYKAAERVFLDKIRELDGDSLLEVLEGAWTDSLRAAYGNIEPDDNLFVRHTYLAILARLLVWVALEQRAIDPNDIDDVLSGRYFLEKGVVNLVEEDFFNWYQIHSETSLRPVLSALARQLAGYDLTAIHEDILKPLYEQLVDPATRKDLGEFYTPDWLATAVTNELLENWNWDSTPAVLDPACGSGTFLRAVIALVRSKTLIADSDLLLQSIVANVMGIDVHPLAVIIARATYLLAIKDLVETATVSIPVFLANSLRTPELGFQQSLFGVEVPLRVGDAQFSVPATFIQGDKFDRAIEEVINVSRSYADSEAPLEDASTSLKNSLASIIDSTDDNILLLDTLGAMARHIAELKRDRKDTIYGFLLKNHYRPSMLAHYFDFVIGNPPWLTLSDVASPEYKAWLVRIVRESGIAARSVGAQAHTELATLFLVVAASAFLKREESSTPRIGLVMTRGLFNATQHKNLREGRFRSQFNIVKIWDLKDVKELFRVPSCVIFAAATMPPELTPKQGLVWSGTLREKEASWADASPHLTKLQTQFELAYLGRRSTWRMVGGAATTTESSRQHYTRLFRQGAIIYPQVLFVVRPTRQVGRRGSVMVRTDPEAVRLAQLLRGTRVHHLVDAANLYYTAAAEHLLPYALREDLWTVVLPTVRDPGQAEFAPVPSDALRRNGRVNTADWLDWAQAQWETVRKPGDSSELNERLDYLGQFSAQAAKKRYLVLYAAQGKRPVCAVIDTATLDKPFVVRDKTYWASFDDMNEALYVTGFLNSDFAIERIRDWMTQGLFGPRDIHKRVLDVPWPEYDAADVLHEELAIVVEKLVANANSRKLGLPTTMNRGRRRTTLRDGLDKVLLAEVERLVAAISSTA